MTTRTFELNLFDTTRTGPLTVALLLGILALLGLAGWLLVQVGWPVAALVLGGGGYLGWRAYRQAAVVPAVITLTPTEMRVEDLRSEPRLSQTLRLADITTYRYSNFNNREELWLKRATAPPLKLRSAGLLAAGSNLGELLAAFEQVLEAVPGSAGEVSRREKSFFEKPVSTYLLVVFTLVLAGLAWGIIAGDRKLHGNAIGVISSYVAYVAAWRAAAPRRNAP